jgi:hypothetical protein
MRFATIPPDSPQGIAVTMQNPATDFEALGRQVWDAWTRHWTAPPAPATAPSSIPGMGGLQGYFDWMQQAATSALGPAAGAPVQVPPSMQPFAGWNMSGPGAAFPAGFDALHDLLKTPAFGHNREQQAEQQALMRAMLDHQQASARYQQLIARAQVEGAERLQRKLAEPGTATTSLKAMYDLWVDAVEEAYAEIALSDEFREVYAAQANTQMRVRQLQLAQMERWCREAGLPTRSEVDTLGQRLQELRRELRRMQAAVAPAAADGKNVKKAKRSTASIKPEAQAKAKPAARTAARRAPRKAR